MAEKQDPLDWQDDEAALDLTGAIRKWLDLADNAFDRRDTPEIEVVIDDSLAA